MGLKIKSFIITFLMITGFAATINAAWEGPVELISGTWGSGNDQFGIEYEDTHDSFPSRFYILLDGGIIIRDIINGRRKVYSNNYTLIKTVKCVESQTGEWNEECNILGEYIQTTQDGNIWVDLSEHQKPKYSLYSPTGNLIRTTTERPLELGKVKEKKKTAAGYTYTVQYPEITNPNTVKTYTVSVGGALSKFMGRFQRDTNGNLYGVFGKNVVRFDDTGSITAQMQIPVDVKGERVKDPFGASTRKPIIEEYGSAVISPTGDVYTWKRTPTAYSIIKWTWR